MFNVKTKKHGKTYAREIESIKQKIVKARDRGVCDNEGRTLKKNGVIQSNAGKGDRRRIWNRLPTLLNDITNVWPRDEFGNLIGD